MEDRPEVLRDYLKKEDKVWGRERWIVNNELYCSKILDLTCGGQSSVHYHKVKDETFHILEGSCFLQVGHITYLLIPKSTVRILPGQHHTFWCTPDMLMGCKILEMSTPHSEDDVVRLRESRRLK